MCGTVLVVLLLINPHYIILIIGGSKGRHHMNEERRRWDLPLLGIEELTLVHAPCTTVRIMHGCMRGTLSGLSDWPRSIHYHNKTRERTIDQKSTITHDHKKLQDQTINSPNHCGHQSIFCSYELK